MPKLTMTVEIVAETMEEAEAAMEALTHCVIDITNGEPATVSLYEPHEVDPDYQDEE